MYFFHVEMWADFYKKYGLPKNLLTLQTAHSAHCTLQAAAGSTVCYAEPGGGGVPERGRDERGGGGGPRRHAQAAQRAQVQVFRI